MSRKRQLVNAEYAKFSMALDTSQIIDPYKIGGLLIQTYGGMSMGLLQPFHNGWP